MRLLVILSILFSFTSALYAQVNSGNMGLDIKNNFVDNFISRKNQGTDFNEISGSAFLNKEFRNGQIVLRSGQVFTDVQIRFNAYQNEVVAKKNGLAYAIDTAKEVSYYDIEGSPASIVVLRSGYPNIGNLTNGSYYQLVAGGKKVHMLRYVHRRIQERNVPGYDNMKEFLNSSDWYLFSEKDGIQKIKVNKKQVEAALSSYAAEIAKATAKFSLNVGKEDDLIILVNEIDAQ